MDRCSQVIAIEGGTEKLYLVLDLRAGNCFIKYCVFDGNISHVWKAMILRVTPVARGMHLLKLFVQ